MRRLGVQGFPGGSLATGTGASESDVAGAHLSLSVHADGSSVLQGRAEGAAAGRGDGGSSFAVMVLLSNVLL